MIPGLARFRPRLIPTLITLVFFLACSGLGVWQVQRLHWKEGLITERKAALAASPVALPAAIAAARALGGRRVVDRGVFLNDREIAVHAIDREGDAGFDIFTPLREPDGRLIFVNRGFVPAALKSGAARPAGEPQGGVRVGGILALPSKAGLFVPDNQPARGEWFRVDLPAMAKAAGLSAVAPFYIEADATPNPGGWPRGDANVPELPNHHLQYAITWFALAGAAVVIYVLAQRGNSADRRRT